MSNEHQPDEVACWGNPPVIFRRRRERQDPKVELIEYYQRSQQLLWDLVRYEADFGMSLLPPPIRQELEDLLPESPPPSVKPLKRLGL